MACDYSMRYLRHRRMRGRSPAVQPAPFVVGTGRSGTTLVRMMLDAHPQLAVPPETHFVSAVVKRSGRLRFNAKVAVQTIVMHQRWNDFGLSPDDLLARFEAIEPFNTTDALRSFYGLYAEHHDKSRWGDKTPRYLDEMRRIQEVLPEVRFIHVIRDGRDVSLSFMRVGWGHATLGAGARMWRDRIHNARRVASSIDHYMEVRYEDLILDIEPTLRRVAEFIELPWDDAMLAYHERAGERLQEIAGALPATKSRPSREAGERMAAHVMTTKPPSAERVAVWTREMSEAENAEYEEAAGYLLDELGYETVTPRQRWLAPEEWGRSSDPTRLGRRGGGMLLSRLRRRSAK
jgi:hypothetical protein